MLIVEGPDGVGKTTLCEKLLAVLPTHVYAHFTRLPPGFDHPWDYLARTSRRVVQDRFHLSEPAYAEARGDADRLLLTPELYRLVDARLRQLGGVTVLLTADDALVRSRWDASQMFDVGRTLLASRAYRRLLAGQTPYRPDLDLHYHLTTERPYVTDDQVDEVLGLYRRRQSALDETLSRRPASL